MGGQGSQFVDTWKQAIARVEGYDIAGSVAQRNNNPGNIKGSGDLGTDERGFAKYSKPELGWAALEKDLNAKIAMYPNYTLIQIMDRYLGGSDPNNPMITNQGNPFSYAKSIADAAGVDPTAKLGDLKKGTAPAKGTNPYTGPMPVADGTDTRVRSQVSDAFKPLNYTELSYTPVSDSILNERVMDLVIPEGLDNEPWWDKGLVGNPHLKRIGQPVIFKILLNDLAPDRYLPKKDKSTDPLEIRLNCSLSTVSQQMKHVINKANTRTGFHLTFWGMEPDVITGSGSTGLFLNSFGVTDLMSLSGTLQELGLLDAAQQEQSSNLSEDLNFAKDKAASDYWQSHIYTGYNGQPVDSGSPITSPSGEMSSKMRVAAQDAFVELLSLFKNNGVVRYKTDNYDSSFDNRTQLQPSVWSEQFGASTFQRKARNNDIMTKGSVVMSYKGNVFQGYFKSFNWTMDADTPFQWKFDFTFQVQHTISYVFYAT